MSETPDVVYGRLLEAAHISGYTFERLCDELLTLLDGDAWRQVGPGYGDVNAFLRSIDLSPFNLGDNRPKLHRRIKELQPKASTRAMGEMTGTPHTTVQRHVSVPNGTSERLAETSGQPEQSDRVPFGTPGSMSGREAAKAVKKVAAKEQRVAERELREQQRAAERAQQPAPTLPDGIHIEQCRAKDLIGHIQPGTVDLIFTDPPYKVELTECWTELGELAAKALKQGGLLVAYSGQHTMPQALDRLRDAGLAWYWCYAIQHDGAFFQMYATRVQCGWKPLLVMRNGVGEPPNWHKDIVTNGSREKAGHEWQQSEAEATYWITELTKPDDLVVDPFIGSGTTAAVCRNLGRRFIGCDVDVTVVEAARERVS